MEDSTLPNAGGTGDYYGRPAARPQRVPQLCRGDDLMISRRRDKGRGVGTQVSSLGTRRPNELEPASMDVLLS